MMLALSWGDLNPLNWGKKIIGGAVDGAFNFLADWIGKAVAWLAEAVMSRIVAAGSADLVEEMFVHEDGTASPAGIVMWLGLASVVVGVSYQVISVTWRDNGGGVELRETVIDLPVTVMAMFAVPTVAVAVLDVCDAAALAIGSDAVVTGVGKNLKPAPGVPGALRSLIGVFMLLALLVLYVEQLVRSHLATVFVVLGPLLVALRSYRPAAMVLAAAVKTFAALAVTPLIMMVSLSVALYRYEAVGTLDFARSMGVLAGIMMAVVSPFLAARLFPVGDGISAGLAGGAVVGGGLMALQAAGGGLALAGGGATAAASRVDQLVSSDSTPGGGDQGGASAGTQAALAGSGSTYPSGGPGGSGGGGSGGGGWDDGGSDGVGPSSPGRPPPPTGPAAGGASVAAGEQTPTDAGPPSVQGEAPPAGPPSSSSDDGPPPDSGRRDGLTN